MSKSTKAENSKIMLDDEPAKAAKKIMSATTDSMAKVKFDMFNQPGISNLLQIKALISGAPLQDVISEWTGETRYGNLKRAVAEDVTQALTKFQAKMAEISDEQIYDLLAEGEKYANEVANTKLLEAQKAFHLR